MSRKQGYPSHLAARAQLDRIPLPDKIKCSHCQKVKGPSAFSEQSHRRIRTVVNTEGTGAVGPTSKGRARCTTCTAQIVEKTCWECDKTKDIEKFNNTQRKSDEGICEACCRVRDGRPARESDDEDDDEDDDDDEEDSSSNDDSDSDNGAMSTLTGNLTGASIWDASDTASTRTVGVPLPARSVNTVSSGPSRGVYVNSPGPRSIAGSAISGSTATTFNTRAYGSPRSSTSIASTKVGDASVTSRFAKPPASLKGGAPLKVANRGTESSLDEIAVAHYSDSDEED